MANVLIVDNEKNIRKILGEFLREEGHNVRVAEDAAIATSLLKMEDFDFDVVVTDIILPKMQGVDFLKNIHESRSGVQVILITGNPTVKTASAAVRCGAFDYLPKPITREIFVKSVANAVKAKYRNEANHIVKEDNRMYRENLKQMVANRTTALRTSEEWLSTLFEVSKDAIIIIDREGKIEMSNPAAEEMFGRSTADLRGQELTRLIPEEFQEKNIEVDSPCLRMENTSGCMDRAIEFTGLRVNGSRFPLELTLSSCGHSENWAVMAIIRDLSRRKYMEKELRTRALQQEAVAKLGRIALADVSLDEFFDETVDVVSKIMGIKFSMILQLLPDQKALLMRAGSGWEKGLVGSATVGTGKNSQAGYTLHSHKAVVMDDLKTEKRFKCPPLLIDHKVVSGITVIIGKSEDPFGILTAHTTESRMFTKDDVNFMEATANLLAEVVKRANFEEKQARLVTAIEQAVEIIVITDSQRSIQYVNPAFQSITGYSSEDVIGKTPGSA